MTDSHDAPQIDETRLQAIRRRIEEVAGGRAAARQACARTDDDQAQSRPEGLRGLGRRVGAQSGNVSELTAIARLKPGGAERLRRIFDLVNGNFDGAQKVGTLHDMRFAFFDDDTRILFATTYDGDWDTYINDFATKIPDLMDLLFQSVEGWPGIKSPKSQGLHRRTSDHRGRLVRGQPTGHGRRRAPAPALGARVQRIPGQGGLKHVDHRTTSHRASAETPSRWSSTTSRR